MLDRQALKHTPWADMDPDLSLFKALAPCFSTSFERTSWLIRRRDGTAVELALDIGQIEANGKHTPICELELELKAGKPAALFAIAQEIAHLHDARITPSDDLDGTGNTFTVSFESHPG